jgi:UDP-glucuronate 4-epimerase
MKPTKKILITGSSGFIGSNLVEYLCKRYNTILDYEIIGIDRNPYPLPLTKVHKNFKPILLDINDNTHGLPDIDGVEVVIHLAGRAGVRESREHFDEYVQDNIIGSKNVLNKCVNQWKPKLFIYSSSSSVYGDCLTKAKETDATHPMSPYALTKVAVEKLIETYFNNHTIGSTKCTVLRFFTVYGPRQREGLAIRNFIDKILEHEPITLYGDGTQSRDFLYINDLCDGIRRLIEDIDSIPIGCNIYNISPSNPITINEIIHLIATLLNTEVTIKYEPFNKFDVMRTAADISKLTNLLCWSPSVSIEEGIKMQIDWAQRGRKK